MKKCKSCKSEIDAKATKCPHCQADQRGWMRRHPILTGILILFIIGAIGAGLGGDKSKQTSNNMQSSSKSTEQQGNTNTATSMNSDASNKQQDATPKVGDVTKLGDREFIVNSVRRSGAFNYNTPKSGKEYVIVNVTIKNQGKDEVSYNPYDFKVQDANGAQENQAFAVLDDSLSSGTLALGGKVTGSIPFEVPIGDQAKLIFQPSFWSNQRVVVDLGNK
jgi:hypothetical protein